MKRALTVSVVLIMVLLVFTAQNGRAEEDPFDIGMMAAMDGEFDRPSGIWTLWSVLNVAVSYNIGQDKVAFEEYPESGNGTGVWWIKDFNQNTYVKYTFMVKNNEVQEETLQQVPVTKKEAEQAAWKILRYLGYSK